MQLNLSKYPQVVVSLIQQKTIQYDINIHEVEVFEIDGWNWFFRGAIVFLKTEKYTPKKEAPVFIDPDRPAKICIAEPKQKIKKTKLPTPNKIPLRKMVYHRDEYKCLKCGENNINALTLDHIIPKSKGGKNTIDNLQTLCANCNFAKADKHETDYRK